MPSERFTRVFDREYAVDRRRERTLRDEGASTDFVVLRAERDLTSRRYSEIRAKADYLIALVRLAEAEASILDKHGINVEFVEE